MLLTKSTLSFVTKLFHLAHGYGPKLWARMNFKDKPYCAENSLVRGDLSLNKYTLRPTSKGYIVPHAMCKTLRRNGDKHF